MLTFDLTLPIGGAGKVPSRTARLTRQRSFLLCAALLAATATPVAAAAPAPAPQASSTRSASPGAEPTPDVPPASSAAAAVPPAGPDYLFPDLAPKALEYDGERFFFRPIFAGVLDYTWFDQDATSLAQVGRQENEGELRAGRIGFSLRSKSRFKWDLYATSDYQEEKTREGAVLQIFDLKIGVPLGPAKLYVGKQKETFSYEIVALSVMLPHQERILLPFYVTRSIGAQLSGRLAGDRMTWSAGVFNDWLDADLDRSENGTDYVGRLSALAFESADKRDYLHLGVGYRRAGSDDGTMRFSGRPESNVATKFTDTGDFPADHADNLSLEALWSRGPFSVLAERIDARVDSPETGDPYFFGYYAAASWIVTGEGRPYVRTGGYAGGIVPRSRYGAWELVLKYSHVDLTDGALEGGVLDKWHVGLNWWASAQWKVGLSWGDADLDKGGLDGNTKMVLARLQWLW